MRLFHTLTLVPTAESVHQVVSLPALTDVNAFAQALFSRLSVRVVAESAYGSSDSTQLHNGSPLSELIGEVTIEAHTQDKRSDASAPHGIIAYEHHHSDVNYFVSLGVSADAFDLIATLTQNRRLERIEITIAAPNAGDGASDIPGDTPGLHTNGGLRRAPYFVWDPKEILQIAAFKFEFELNREENPRNRVKKNALPIAAIVNAAHRTLARIVTQYPQGTWKGEGIQFGSQAAPRAEAPTAEQVKAIANTHAGRQIRDLVQTVYAATLDANTARMVAQCAVEFAGTNGMIYRARARQVENSDAKTAAPIIPPHLTLWLPPPIGGDRSFSGWNSLEGLARDALQNVAASFYQSGARCSWFEKMLVEALIGAETYATVKMSKTTPSVWTRKVMFIRTMIASWAFSRSKGGPMYLTYVTIGNAALGAAKIAILAGAAWVAFEKYSRTNSWQSAAVLLIVALVVIGWGGRYLVRLIVSWSKAFPATFGAGALSSPFGKALSALLMAYSIVSSDLSSTTSARDSIKSAISAGAGIDHIALAFLDRAIDADEFLWARSPGALADVPELDE